MQVQGEHRLDSAVRTLAAAGKALRLYPPTSSIPRQTVQSAQAALAGYFAAGAQLLSLAVARDGFTLGGEPFGGGITGARELSDTLRSHAIAELVIMPGCTADELLGFLTQTLRSPDEVRAEGGLATTLVASGVETIRVTGVRLTVVDQATPQPVDDIDGFLRDLAQDSTKLSAWFGAVSGGDPAAFEDGLAELARISGAGGLDSMLRSLASAFREQGPESRDALLALAMDDGPARAITAGMFSHLSSGEIAGSILEGSFGKNMLSLSSALTNLPLERVTAEVRAQVQALLPSAGHSAKEADFLEHMLDVRSKPAERPLLDADATYRAVADATRVTERAVAEARDGAAASHGTMTSSGVHMMLRLLDQQKDFELYCASAQSLAATVPRLIAQGDLDLAARVLSELSSRETFNASPWPQLSVRLREAMTRAAGPDAMSALLHAVAKDGTRVAVAREIVRYSREAGPPVLVAAAITLKEQGLRIAEEIVGRRVVDALNEQAAALPFFQLAPVVARLAREGDPRSLATVEALLGRPDAQSRREVATGLAMAGGVAATRLLARVLRDTSAEVQTVAVRALVRHQAPGAAELLATRLAELEVDNGDFALAREIIGALATLPGRVADEALGRMASRRTLIKRGHFAEVQELVRQAQAVRSRGGGSA